MTLEGQRFAQNCINQSAIDGSRCQARSARLALMQLVWGPVYECTYPNEKARQSRAFERALKLKSSAEYAHRVRRRAGQGKNTQGNQRRFHGSNSKSREAMRSISPSRTSYKNDRFGLFASIETCPRVVRSAHMNSHRCEKQIPGTFWHANRNC